MKLAITTHNQLGCGLENSECAKVAGIFLPHGYSFVYKVCFRSRTSRASGSVKQGGVRSRGTPFRLWRVSPRPPSHGSVLQGPVAEGRSLAPRVMTLAEPVACLPIFLLVGPQSPGRQRKKGRLAIAHSRTHPFETRPVTHSSPRSPSRPPRMQPLAPSRSATAATTR